jgi:arginine decarboxylase-like protein
MEIHYEGPESFFQSNITKQLENYTAVITAAHNLQNKRDLTEIIESLQLHLASLENNIDTIAELNEEQAKQNKEMVEAISQHCEAILNEKKGSAKLFEATRQMQEMSMSFNLQYLMLQNKISHENRQFTMVSNIMKNKHDTAKNSINNIR